MIETKRLFFRDTLSTPLGLLNIVSDEQQQLKAVLWDDKGHVLKLLTVECGKNFLLQEKRDAGGLTAKLEAYFAGDLDVIQTLPVASCGTSFQQSVWRALREIPTGTTTSYGRLAGKLGMPTGARAVGLANGSNPVAVVVPCHRVIGASGSLTGYAGGLERKAWLLRHEGFLLL